MPEILDRMIHVDLNERTILIQSRQLVEHVCRRSNIVRDGRTRYFSTEVIVAKPFDARGSIVALIGSYTTCHLSSTRTVVLCPHVSSHQT